MLSAHLPSTWKRLAANAIDELIMIPLYAPFFGIFFKMLTSDDGVTIPIQTFAVILIIPAVYEFVFLLLMQATPAKWLLGMKVVPCEDIDAQINWQQALLRALVKRLSLFLSLAIYVVALFRYDRTHLADWVAETRVVQVMPRKKRPQIRWVLGSLFLIYFCIEGLSAARTVIKAIDWQNNQVHLDQLMDGYQIDGLEEFEDLEE